MLRLAAPNLVFTLLQASTGLVDAWVVSALGSEALAGISLVFPAVMLMQTMSAGGMGGGVASAVARALGSGERERASVVALHAIGLGLLLASLFTAGFLLGGPALYARMGGRGAALEHALAYSNVLFAGAAANWLFNTLASATRGTGHMLLPATVATGVSLLQMTLCTLLVPGHAGLPRLGVAGVGAASVIAFGLGAIVLLAHLTSGRALIVLRPAALRPRAWPFADILRVGAPSALNNLLTSGTALGLTALVGRAGTQALAGYGMGARLEYLLIPLVFGFGSGLVAMVGANVGAGQVERAERIAWVGAGLAATLTGAVGLTVAVCPRAWLGLFTAEPAVLAMGAAYFRIVGPFYAFLGAGFALYFASQGAGRLLFPLTASALRFVVAFLGGGAALDLLGGGPGALFGCMAAGLATLGLVNVAALGAGAWRRGSPA